MTNVTLNGIYPVKATSSQIGLHGARLQQNKLNKLNKYVAEKYNRIKYLLIQVSKRIGHFNLHSFITF